MTHRELAERAVGITVGSFLIWLTYHLLTVNEVQVSGGTPGTVVAALIGLTGLLIAGGSFLIPSRRH